MDDRFKFRAWDKKEEEMIYCSEEYPFTFPLLDAEDLILMQSTGLRDKKGELIFEGDIVNIKHPKDKGGDFWNTHGIVYWDDANLQFIHSHLQVKKSCGRPFKAFWEVADYKILGNIYQNPELLEGNGSSTRRL